MDKKRMVANLVEAIYLAGMFLYMLVLKSVYSVASSYDFLMFICISALIIGILILIGPRFNRYFGFIFAFLYTLYLIAQQVYYRGFGQYFRFSTALGLASEVAGVTDSAIELIHFSDIIPFIVLTVFTIAFVILHFTLQKEYRLGKLRLLSIAFLLVGASSFLYNNHLIQKSCEGWTDFDIYKSDFYIYDALPNSNQFVDKFGLLNLFYRDGVMTVSHGSQINNYQEEIDAFFAGKDNSHAANEMTGIFKDKSVLLIQAESFMNLAISEEFTPNLYYYMTSGIHVQNFNTPLLTGSTSDTEFMANTSLIPMSGGYPVCYEYINNTYPLTLGNIFKENGYQTTAYHNNYAEYYNRDTVFLKYGYEFFDSYKMGLENLEPDTKLAEAIGWILSERPKFMAYWVTYSGHQPYSIGEVGVDPADVAKIQEAYPDLDEEYVAYIAKAMDVDKAVSTFINVMDWSGRLDDVVIVFYGDHICKGIDFSKGSNYDEVFHQNSDDNPEITYTPLIIWANGIEHREYDKVSTSLDILPTLINMWGFDTYLSYAFGHDIFDPEYEGFYFDESGNLANDNFSYNIIDDTLVTNNAYSEEEAMNDVAYFNELKDICSKILQSDYFGEDE